MNHVNLGCDIFTSGQIAALCDVSRGTVLRWIDRGQLPGWHVPSLQSRHRRVSRPALERFLREHGLTAALARLERRP